MDPKLDKQFSPEAATNLLTIALSCVARDDSARPDMADVLRGLERIGRGGLNTGSFRSDTTPQESVLGGSESWFAASRGGSARSSDLSSGPSSYSTWSQPSLHSDGSNVNQSVAYQMTMIKEGR
jgi:hypothetical protein